MKKNNVLKLSLAVGIGLVLLQTSGCSSSPSRGSPEYIREQVYECRQLCANGEINITKIEGLDCVCNKPQQPFIYNPMMSGGNGGGGSSSSSSSSTGSTQSSNDRGSVLTPPVFVNAAPQQTVQPTLPQLLPNVNASQTEDAAGHKILSQVKE